MFNGAKILATVSTVALTAACGGGGGSEGGGSAGDSGVPPSAGAPSFQELLNENEVLTERYESEFFTDPSTLPTSSTATYNGVLGVVTDEVTAGGQLRLTADFEAATNSITGDVRNIVDSNNQSFGGTLTLSDGFIDRTADVTLVYTFGAQLDGNLTQSGENFVVEAGIFGDFIGENYQAVEGIVFGSVSSQGGTSTIVDGGFIAER